MGSPPRGDAARAARTERLACRGPTVPASGSPARWTTRTITRSSGVPRTATQTEIKKAFRKLAREHHPDTKPGEPRPSGGSRRSTRPTPSCPTRRSGRSTTGSARTGRPTPAPARLRARRPGAPGRRASVRRAVRWLRRGARAATSATSSARPATRASSATSSTPSSRGASEPVARVRQRPGRGRRPTGGPTFEDILAGMGLDGDPARAARAGRSGTRTTAAAPLDRRPPRPSPRSPSTRPTTARPG